MPVTAVLIVDSKTVLVERVEDPLKWAKRVRPELKWFDSFPATVSEAGVIVWVDDMGVFTNLPVNNLANALLQPAYPLVGPVLLTGRSNEAGDLTDIDERVVQRTRTYE